MTKSILNLSISELKEIVEKDALPSDTNLSGIEERKDFQKLFRFRSSPRSIATILLREKLKEGKKGGSYETEEVKQRRLELREKELELKRLKAEGTSYQLKQIFKLLKELDQKLNFLMRGKDGKDE